MQNSITSPTSAKPRLFQELCADLIAYNVSNPNLLKILWRLCITPGFLAGFLYRVSARLTRSGVFGKVLARLFWRTNVLINSCDICPHAQIGPGLYLPHPMGVVIGAAVIGDRAIILQNCSIGKKDVRSGQEHCSFPQIGNDVIIGAGACVLGYINVGNNARIGANAVVLCDLPDGCMAAGVPAQIRF